MNFAAKIFHDMIHLVQYYEFVVEYGHPGPSGSYYCTNSTNPFKSADLSSHQLPGWKLKFNQSD